MKKQPRKITKKELKERTEMMKKSKRKKDRNLMKSNQRKVKHSNHCLQLNMKRIKIWTFYVDVYIEVLDEHTYKHS